MSTELLGELLSVAMFLTTIAAVMAGYPVAFTLAGVGLFFAALGMGVGVFDTAILSALAERYFGTITNETLVAVPLFVFMGVMLERSKIADAIGEARRIRDSSYGGPALTYLLSDGTVSGTMPNKCTLAPISPIPPPRTSI
jgi:TRAP-type mannitol/chloroaromatic compound transport system permease large subunit